MSESRIETRLRARRRAAGLSQIALAERVGVSRQAIVAIEAERNVPSTTLSLRLSRSLACRVEDIFRLTPTADLEARLAPAAEGCEGSARAALARVAGGWVAHRLPSLGTAAADAIVTARAGGRATLRPLYGGAKLERGVLIAGCAPLLGVAASRANRRFADTRARWLPAGNGRSLELLAGGFVHMAGLHLDGGERPDATIAAARRALPARRLRIVHLTRWRQGLVLPPGNPLALASGADLTRPGVRFAGREEGSGARTLAGRFIEADDGPWPLAGPSADGHSMVARLVLAGAADAGVAIEGAALAAGLDFLPLAEERFDIVLPAESAATPPVSHVLETLADPSFRADVEGMPGYDHSLSGQVATVEAA